MQTKDAKAALLKVNSDLTTVWCALCALEGDLKTREAIHAQLAAIDAIQDVILDVTFS